jgi:hypothetical protein
MPPEGLIELETEDTNPQEEDFSSWETTASDPDIEDPYAALYELIEQDLWVGHVRDSD